jgi:hypothetical protein
VNDSYGRLLIPTFYFTSTTNQKIMNRNGYIQVLIPLQDEEGQPLERKQGFKFNMGTLSRYCKLRNVPVNKLQESLKEEHPEYLESIRDLLYAAAVTNSELARKKIDYIQADVEEWISQMSQDSFKSIIQAFEDSKFLGNSLGANKQETAPQPTI